LHWYIIAPISTLILAVALGTYVIQKDPKNKIRWAFFMLTVWIDIASLGDIGMLATTDAGIASRFFHIKWLGMAFVEPAILDLVLASSVWSARWDHPVRKFVIYILPFSLIILDAMGDILKGIQLQPWGYDAVYGPLFLLWTVFWLLIIVSGVFVLAMDLKDKKNPQRPVYITLLIAILIPTIINSLFQGINMYYQMPLMIPTYISLILFLLFFELSIYRRRIFVLTPKKERIKDDANISKMSLPPGHIYRLEGEPPPVFYDLFKHLVLSDLFGLVISRKPPQSIKKATGLKDTNMIWISSTPKEGINTIAPSEIGQIIQTVKEFIKRAGETIVLIDGLEFLIFENGPKMTLSALFLLSEIVMNSNARVIIPVDPTAIEPSILALIRRETVDLRTVKGFEREPVGKT